MYTGCSYGGDWMASPSPSWLPQRDVQTHDMLLVSSSKYTAINASLVTRLNACMRLSSILHMGKNPMLSAEQDYHICNFVCNSNPANRHSHMYIPTGILMCQVVLSSLIYCSLCLDQNMSCSSFLRRSAEVILRPLSWELH